MDPGPEPVKPPDFPFEQARSLLAAIDAFQTQVATFTRVDRQSVEELVATTRGEQFLGFRRDSGALLQRMLDATFETLEHEREAVRIHMDQARAELDAWVAAHAAWGARAALTGTASV